MDVLEVLIVVGIVGLGIVVVLPLLKPTAPRVAPVRHHATASPPVVVHHAPPSPPPVTRAHPFRRTHAPVVRGGGGRAGTTAAKVGGLIYKTTGRIIHGSVIAYDTRSSKNYPMASGGRRPSWRWGSWAGHGGGCIPFFNKEITVYLTLGRVQDPKQRVIVSSGGGRQSGHNCCVYSLGFTLGGTSWLEEEGPRQPGPHITGNLIHRPVSIGSLSGRTIGIKHIQYRKGGHTYVQGYVDRANNGRWQLFFSGVDPHGTYHQGGRAPVITHVGMSGERCQELRVRADSVSSLTVHQNRSSIAEIAV